MTADKVIVPDNVELAYSMHQKEYELLRNELCTLLEIQATLLNYAVTIIVATVTLFLVGNNPITRNEPAIFLLASILITALLWMDLEKSIQVTDISRYIMDVLKPKIQTLVGTSVKSEFIVIGFEDYRRESSFLHLTRGLTATGRTAILLISSVVFIVIFCSLRDPSQQAWKPIESLLFYIAAVLVFLAPGVGILNAVLQIRKRK